MEDKDCVNGGCDSWENSDGCDQIGIPVKHNYFYNVPVEENIKTSVYISPNTLVGNDSYYTTPIYKLSKEDISEIANQVAKKINHENLMLNELVDSLYSEIAELNSEISTLKRTRE